MAMSLQGDDAILLIIIKTLKYTEKEAFCAVMTGVTSSINQQRLKLKCLFVF